MYTFSEYLEGGELFQKIIKQKGLTEESARNFSYDILNGINYCHKKGIIHGDIKPENMILDIKNQKEVLKIIDFGTSENLSSGNINGKTATGTVKA